MAEPGGAFDLTAANPLMKIHFAPKIPKEFNSAAILYNDLFEGKGIPISNRGYEIPVHMGPGASDTWYGDGGTLPAGDGETVKTASVGFFSYARAIQFTGAALDAAGDDAVTYARALAFNIRNGVINAVKMLNIFSFGTGSGILAEVGAGSNTNVLSTVANNTIDVSGLGDGARFLRPGQTVDIVTGTTTPVKATLQVVSLPSVISFPGTFTASGGISTPINVVFGPASAAATLATGDGIVLTGSLNSVMIGIRGIIDDGTVTPTFQTITRSSNPQYQSVVVNANSQALARDYLRRGLSNIQQARGMVKTSSLRLWSHTSQVHAYMDMGWTLKRFNMTTAGKMDLGFTAVEWEGIPWVVDTDAPRDHIFYVDKESMFKVTARALSFDTRSGSILRQIPSATAGQYADKFVAFLIFRGNLGSYAPNASTKIINLFVPAGY